ncbi:MAG: HXXEE domain-containing protein [Bacteroidales bacterium]|nr:HXXEE domain-containing protein [Bacteroidales bacterium]
MKNFILKYNLLIYGLIVGCVVVIYEVINGGVLSPARVLVLLMMVMSILHEIEEKVWPGGFFELLGPVWGWDVKNVDFRKPGLCVTCLWLLLVLPAWIWEWKFLLTAMIILGLFETFVHTVGGLKFCKGKYIPGIFTALLMGAVSIYCIVLLKRTGSVVGLDYLWGALTFIGVMALLQMLVQASANYSVPRMMKHMIAAIKKQDGHTMGEV